MPDCAVANFLGGFCARWYHAPFNERSGAGTYLNRKNAVNSVEIDCEAAFVAEQQTSSTGLGFQSP